MKTTIPYRIIVIGGNHINTLSVIRCLGKCHCDIHVLIHSEQPTSRISCANSRFSIGRTTIVKANEEEILRWLLENSTCDKQIVFPCSDFAAYVIDKNYNLLVPYYFLPGFDDHPGLVCVMMNKWQQKLFADRNNILMAESLLVSNLADVHCLDDKNIFPCIVKPNVSAYGKKSDIRICSNKNELLNTVEHLLEIGYEELLIQEYLEKTHEYDCQGFISNHRNVCEAYVAKKIFDLSGNTVYACFDNSELVLNTNHAIIDALYEMGFRGVYDIEYIISDGQVYLLEINFRHSGAGFGLIKNGVYLPYLGCLSLCGLEQNISNYKLRIRPNRYLMDETVCFNHRKEFGLGVLSWLLLCLKRCCFAKFDIRDLRGTVFLYKEILKRH